MAGEASYVHLVHNSARGGPFWLCVTFPVIGVHIYNHTLHRFRGIVAGLLRGIATVIPWNNDAAPVGIEQHFAGIETHSTWRIEGSFDSITIDLPCLYLRYKSVPVVIGPVSCRIDRNHTCRLSIVDTIKQKEFNTRRAF